MALKAFKMKGDEPKTDIMRRGMYSNYLSKDLGAKNNSGSLPPGSGWEGSPCRPG